MAGFRSFVLAASLVVSATASTAALAESCLEYSEICESVCTPARVARYYAGVEKRCLSSCGPRFQQCMRTGWWADLERQRSGGWERATRF